MADFYQRVACWPTGSEEFSRVAEELAALLEVPLVALYDLEDTVETFGINPGAQGSPEALKKLIREQAGFLSEGGALPPLSFARLQLPQSLEIRVYRISSNLKLSSISREKLAPHPSAWLMLGLERALNSQGEILILAAMHRLAELGEIERFEKTLCLRNQFLSIASHELKTPLTAIYGILQLQERILRIKGGDPQSSYLKIVIRQVERLNELIDGLLDVSRIQNGRFMCEPSECDAAVILNEDIASRLNIIALEAGVSIQIESPAQLKAWVDPVRFEEVVTNLVMNAIRFSPEGGMVRVKLQEWQGGFKLLVRDQGPSVALGDRERIFMPFERAQRTARLGGLGLGLFIARQIAQLHQGTVTLLENKHGSLGNTIEAVFPPRTKLRALSA